MLAPVPEITPGHRPGGPQHSAVSSSDQSGLVGSHSGARDTPVTILTWPIHLAEAYVAVHQVKEVVDGYVEISNRLRVVASDQDNLNGLLEATLGIAQDTRSAWDTVSSTYQRLSNVTHGLGLSQQQVLDLTRELAIGAKISGASAQESAAAQAELTHAFATGALQGREFRVLMRDVPALMHELQVASSKTGAEFAEMGKHGQITAQLLIDWFGKAEPALTEKFGRTVPTIADGFTRIHNAAQAFFGDAAVASGTLGTLSAAMDQGRQRVALGLGGVLRAAVGLRGVVGALGDARAGVRPGGREPAERVAGAAGGVARLVEAGLDPGDAGLGVAAALEGDDDVEAHRPPPVRFLSRCRDASRSARS